ncbi:MAG TPA: MarR family winged helix-turn-helix transcriptional regulator [Stellaceae bacterium]|jgi:DNA-binding MarR family transcriptional regulator|nr:MarR family winged helix-turn-helix transcriptional regulator [Stellaceae bacterium]
MKTAAYSRPRHSTASETPTDRAIWRPEDSVGYRLKLALQAWTRFLDAALRPIGLTHLQAIALNTIEIFSEQGETPSQVRIAEFMRLDPMMISKILRLLESRGYIERCAHPDDPRANALHLTLAGKELVLTGSALARAAHARFFDCRLDADGKQTLAALLDHLLLPGTTGAEMSLVQPPAGSG